ncbi:hypothetical protein [Bosea sp. RAC05]|uniref:hypothetical protein n=1 Tax=Bosea sp. RAC05 TaxID=1842539 RepID=UPI00083D1564|nr:hypothetical protein [Bosea sp. RAC05]AOG03197.1 HAD hydrolase, IA, variant 1 family protein [Bosea sp. RAC05]
MGAPLMGFPTDLDLVSFDVFDTLVLRAVGRPVDVFEIMARRRPDLFPSDFAKLRVAAEMNARRHSGTSTAEDVTLAQIYAQMAGRLRGTPDACMTAEIETEISLCRPRSDIKTIFDEAVAAGHRIIAISDMYLPADAVSAILAKCGYGSIPLYVSSELGFTKNSGRIFDEIEALEGVPFRRWLHLGDNERADVMSARSRGIRTIHTHLKEDPLGISSDTDWVDGIYRRIGTIVAQSEPKVGDADDFWQQIAVSIAAPMIVGLCAEIRRRADRLGAHSIYFLARDGLVIQKAYEVLYPDDQRPHVYLHASRRVVNFTAITRIDATALKFLSGGKDHMTLGDILRRVGIVDPDLTMRAAAAGGFDIETVNPRSDKLAKALLVCEAAIVARASQERAVFRRYLESVGFDRSGTSLIVDVGWFCSIQHALQKLVDESNWATTVAGVYLGTKPEAYAANASFPAWGWLYHGDGPAHARKALDRCTEFVELLFASPEHGIIGLEERSGSFEPVRHVQADEETRIFVAERLHQGVVATCRLLVEHQLVDEATNSADLTLRRLDGFLLKPQAPWVAFLSPLRHSLGFGASHYSSFVHQNTRWRSPKSIINAMLTSFWREGFVATAPRQIRFPVYLAVSFGLPAWRLCCRIAKALQRRLPRVEREVL